jgi:ribose-phosphate pyrophosphokinase
MVTLNGVEIKPTIFPDKTSQVWKLPEGLIKEENTIKWRFEFEAELIHLAQLMDLIAVTTGFRSKTNLYMPYLPYARQDKEVSNTSTFALRTFSWLLNKLGFRNVSVFDSHSEVPVINGFKNILPLNEIYTARVAVYPDAVAFPDIGACNRYELCVPMSTPRVFGEKKRNPLTGVIEEYELHGDVKDKAVLIIDDICDGGATFIHLANGLYANGAKEVHLYVSHGIFSKGLQVLRDAGIKRIFTKDGEVK